MSELIQGSPPQRTCQAAELTFIWFWLIACVDFSIVGELYEECRRREFEPNYLVLGIVNATEIARTFRHCPRFRK